MSRERERKLQNDLEAAAARLLHQEQTNTELRRKQDQLIIMIKQQQEENCCNEELLRQVSSELLCLQSSEVTLESLVEGLHAEAQHRAALAEDLEAQLYAEVQCRAALSESLQTELRSKTEEVEKLQDANKTLEEELQDLHNAHHKEVRQLQQENEGSLRKLQETAEQFEWLCQQQRYWMCCVKRFKDNLMKEREALQRQVSKLKKKAGKLKKSSQAESLLCPLQDSERCDSNITSLDPDAVADLESRVEKSNMLYEELFDQAGSPINRYQKPP
ncbi:hypothetical protein PAMA_017011 [Pampus argenteus]